MLKTSRWYCNCNRSDEGVVGAGSGTSATHTEESGERNRHAMSREERGRPRLAWESLEEPEPHSDRLRNPRSPRIRTSISPVRDGIGRGHPVRVRDAGRLASAHEAQVRPNAEHACRPTLSHAHAPSLQGEMLRAMVPSSMFVVPEGRDAGRGHAEEIPALDMWVSCGSAVG